MKKSILTLSFVLCLLISTSHAQQSDFYYTFNNNKINLTKISDKFLAEFPNGLANSSTNPPGQKLTSKCFLVLETQNLNTYGENAKISPTYITEDGTEISYPSEIILHFKNGINNAEKSSLVTSNNLELVKSSSSFNVYRVIGDALQISKMIYTSGKVDFCTPNFYMRFDRTSVDNPPNDEYYSQQWYLNIFLADYRGVSLKKVPCLFTCKSKLNQICAHFKCLLMCLRRIFMNLIRLPTIT
jgi:hypothetical protein